MSVALTIIENALSATYIGATISTKKIDDNQIVIKATNLNGDYVGFNLNRDIISNFRFEAISKVGGEMNTVTLISDYEGKTMKKDDLYSAIFRGIGQFNLEGFKSC